MTDAEKQEMEKKAEEIMQAIAVRHGWEHLMWDRKTVEEAANAADLRRQLEEELIEKEFGKAFLVQFKANQPSKDVVSHLSRIIATLVSRDKEMETLKAQLRSAEAKVHAARVLLARTESFLEPEECACPADHCEERRQILAAIRSLLTPTNESKEEKP